VSATTTERPDVQAYLADVRRELADLDQNERDELLADVEASLHDAAEESDAPIAARLGPPADFAAELRVAAGLGRSEGIVRRIRLRDALQSPEWVRVKHGLVELAPIWWLARAYVAVAVLAWLADDGRSITPPEVFRLGTQNLGFVLLAVASVASVALGFWLRRRGRMGTAAIAVNVALALAAVPVYANLLDWVSNRSGGETIVVQTSVTEGLAVDGVPVENIYPYSRDGRLMLDVLLYDQNGAPLSLRPDDTDPTRRVLRTKAGDGIFNSFPVRYFESGTNRVARPGAAPRVTWSPIVTPPLRRPPTTP
jgi:HAAS domain-containing protein